jgi:hypothetical protein
LKTATPISRKEKTIPKKNQKIIEGLLSSSTVQVNVRLPIKLRARMEEFLQYVDQPSEHRVPDSDNWPTSIQGLVQSAIEDYLALHPLETRRGAARPRRPKPKIKPKKGSQEHQFNKNAKTDLTKGEIHG